MSWLPKSPTSPPPPPPPPPPSNGLDSSAAGVKDDLNELTKSFTRQLWGVATFLAPPPSLQPDTDTDTDADTDTPGIAGIRSDFAEIGGQFKSGISKLSSHKAVSGISKIASNFLPFKPDECHDQDDYYDEHEEEDVFAVTHEVKTSVDEHEEDDAFGVTNEVKTFVHNISMHPETWLDFPLWSDDEDNDDFELSDAQQEHAMAVERISPRLAALRIELCPALMSEGCFWKTYFVLLHPRLDKHDAELLSTPQIVEARELLSKKLQERAKLETESFALDASYRRMNDTTLVYSGEQARTPKDLYESSPSSLPPELEVANNTTQTAEVDLVDKSAAEEEPFKLVQKDQSSTAISNIPITDFDDEDDDWLKEEEDCPSGSITIPLDNEDVSFSDLEDEDISFAPKTMKN